MLLISYHYPPLNVISSLRPEGFARNLQAHDMDITVLTLDWAKGLQKGLPEPTPWIEQSGPVKVIRVPRRQTRLLHLLSALQRIPLLSGLLAITFYLFGKFNISIFQAHGDMFKVLRQYLGTHSFDMVVATMSPDEHLAMAAWCRKVHGIPFIADYRDLYDNRLLSPRFKPSLRDRFMLRIRRGYHRRWTRKAGAVVTVSAPLALVLAKQLRRPAVEVVRNGYNADVIGSIRRSDELPEFVITYSGRLLDTQPLQPFMTAFREFVAALPQDDREKVKLQFFGVRSQRQADQLRMDLGPLISYLSIERIAHEQSLREMERSSILLMFDYGQDGVYSGKLMEYVGMRRNILMIPSDHGVIGELIDQGQLGMHTDHVEEASRFLRKKFDEWKRQGAPIFDGRNDVIESCSQAAQTDILAALITKVLDQQSS